jgi:hypothetical protein
MKIVDSLLQVCGSNVNMFSKQVIKIVIFLTNTREIELVALATQIVSFSPLPPPLPKIEYYPTSFNDSGFFNFL